MSMASDRKLKFTWKSVIYTSFDTATLTNFEEDGKKTLFVAFARLVSL